MRWRTPAVPVRPRLDQGQRARSRATMVVVVAVVTPYLADYICAVTGLWLQDRTCIGEDEL
jgi:hypothetical protein